jgi:pyridoxine 5-phosphate synthase
MPAKLSVNVNAIAYLRNRRDHLPWPDLIGLCRIALKAGAAGITVHPRPDERHIRFSDLAPIRALIDDEFPKAEFNIEGYPTEDFLALCEKHQPEQVTLVPDDPSQATSDHGWDCIANAGLLAKVVGRLKAGRMRVSLFIDPDANEAQIKAAKACGADRVELYTGPYGGTFANPEAAKAQAALLTRTANFAKAHGLGVNAGHDLTVDNLPLLAKVVPDLLEVSIGHGLTADALEYGLAETVKRYVRALG